MPCFRTGRLYKIECAYRILTADRPINVAIIRPGKQMAEEVYADAYIEGKTGSEAMQRATRAEVEYVHASSSSSMPVHEIMEDLIYMGPRVGKKPGGRLHAINQPYGGMGDQAGVHVPDAFLDATGNFTGDFLASTVTGRCTSWYERDEGAAGEI